MNLTRSVEFKRKKVRRKIRRSVQFRENMAAGEAGRQALRVTQHHTLPTIRAVIGVPFCHPQRQRQLASLVLGRWFFHRFLRSQAVRSAFGIEQRLVTSSTGSLLEGLP